MYHDQGLPVLKHASFGHGVNISLGMPIIRTSVDHGTALELAGTGQADPGSMNTAIETALMLIEKHTAPETICHSWKFEEIGPADRRVTQNLSGKLICGIPRKRFGQHFLVDTSVIAEIIHIIHPVPGDRMIEIGPGWVR